MTGTSIPMDIGVWLLSLCGALFASEKLVHHGTTIGHRVGLGPAKLGLLVALGADAPEVTSSLIALARGATDVGLGVVVGSNIYNLAGLLGLSAIVAGRVPTGEARITFDAVINVILSALLFALVTVPQFHHLTGLALLGVLVVYAVQTMRHENPASDPDDPERPGIARPLVYVAVSIAIIVIASDILVGESISLGKTFGIPSAFIGTFVLAIATSLPNTWAAISLARRGLAAAAIATTFTSNSINAAIGAGVPAMFVSLHAAAATRDLELPWLVLMTVAGIILLAFRHTLTRLEGLLLLSLYALFVALRFVLY